MPPQQQNDPYQQEPQQPVPPQPEVVPEYPQLPQPDMQSQPMQNEEADHPFIEPILDSGNSASYGRRMFLWYATRIGAVVVLLGALIGGGVGVYNAFQPSDNKTSQSKEKLQSLYDGDGSDISSTAEPQNTWKCDEGYESDPDDETTCITASPETAALTKSYSCETGYAKTGSGDATKCQKTTKKNPVKASTTYGCPAGYTRADKVCTRTATASPKTSYVCPSGYTRNGNKCTKTTTTYGLVTATCASGYSRSGTGTTATCVRTITATAKKTYSCPSGYKKYQTTKCRRTIAPKANGKCASGYTKTGGKCVRTITATVKTAYSCPAGYKRNGTKCTITVVPSFSCSSGYVKSGSGRDIRCSKLSVTTKTASTKKTCASGYSLSSNTCRKTIKQAANLWYVCPSGHGLSGDTCYQITNQSTKPKVAVSCRSGFQLSDDEERCEKIEREKKDATLVQTCEDGWELLKDDSSGSKCVLVKK